MFVSDGGRRAVLEQALDQLAASPIGAVSCAFFSSGEISSLVSYTQNLEWRRARALVGNGVHQDFDICLPAPRRGGLAQLAAMLESQLADIAARRDNLFDGPVQLNDLAVQRYAPGSKGIGVHRDGARYRNLVCIVTLAGTSRLFIANDRQASQKTMIDDRPGHLVLLAAPGFCGLADPKRRPLHGVDQIRAGRLSIGLRQEQLQA